MASPSDVELKGSEVRLWNLIEQRSRPGADVARIDQRIWDLFGEEWAVMSTDLAGFSRQVESFGIIHFLQEIFEQKRLLLPIVSEHDGVLIKIEAALRDLWRLGPRVDFGALQAPAGAPAFACPVVQARDATNPGPASRDLHPPTLLANA